MKKILILGCAKYSGNTLLKDLMESDNFQITVLSRHKIERVFSIQGDRKNQELLIQTFKRW